MSAISISDLNVWFGEGAEQVLAVKGAAFTVAEGESFGLVGESGSGKSTVLRALAGLVDSWSGDMSVMGTPLGRRRAPAFFKTVQMVFQDPYASLHPRHTVDRVLGEVLKLHGFKDIDARIDQRLGPRETLVAHGRGGGHALLGWHPVVGQGDELAVEREHERTERQVHDEDENARGWDDRTQGCQPTGDGGHDHYDGPPWVAVRESPQRDLQGDGTYDSGRCEQCDPTGAQS